MGGFFARAAEDFEKAAELYEQLGDSENAKKSYEQAMICYERDTSYDDAQKVAKKLNDPRAEIYEEIRRIISKRGTFDGDTERENLLGELEKYREKQ